jgi:energy-coupling factor transport system permease protein
VTPQPYLRRRNPAVKAGVALALSLLLTLVIDPLTPLLATAITLAAGTFAGGVAPRAYARALVPLGLVAVGFVWSNALFAVTADAGGATWQLGPLRASEAGLLFGLAIGLRGFAIGALSLTFILTTDPTDLVVSLIRHGRLSYRVGYALLAGFRFLPFFAQEYEQVRLAQRVRGRTGGRPPLARVREPFVYLLPLLSGAVRRAARIAVAMDARGFTAAGRRTYFRDVPLGWADLLFAFGALAVYASLFAAGAAGGWLRFWDGRFSA